MGKGIAFNKKKRGKMPVTLAELEQAQAEIHEEIAKAKAKGTNDGVIASQAVIYLALNHIYNFGIQRLGRLQDEVTKICDRIYTDKHYSTDDVFAELEKIGITIDAELRYQKPNGFYNWHNIKRHQNDVPVDADRYTVYYTYKEDGRLCGGYGIAWWEDGWYADADHTMEIADGYKIIGWRIDDRFEGEI